MNTLTSEQLPKKRRGRRVVFVAASVVLVAATVIAYYQVFDFGFINYDDPEYIIENHRIHDGLTLDSIEWAFRTVHASNWHPFIWISFMADVEVWGGLDPQGFHLTNVALHIVNGLLLLTVLTLATGRFWPSFLVAGLFLLHPTRVESVAWITERKDTLSAFFGFIAILGYVRYAQTKANRYLFASLVFFAFSLLSKGMFVTLPVVLLVLDFWPLNRLNLETGPLRQRVSSAAPLVAEKLPYFALSGLVAIVTVFAQSAGGAVALSQDITLRDLVPNAILNYFRYIWKTLVPVNLSPFYPHHGEAVSLALAGAALLAVIAITVAALLTRRGQPHVTAGWLWYAITLVPVVGVLQVGSQAMADRYTYIPTIGLFIIVAWSLHRLATTTPRRAVIVAGCVVVLAVCGVMTHQQTAIWSDSVTLWKRAVTLYPESSFAQTMLGHAYYERGEYALAEERFQTALRLSPGPAARYSVQSGLGAMYLETGHLGAAQAHLAEAYEINPDVPRAALNLGKVMLRRGEPEQAVQLISQALPHFQLSAEAHTELGIALTQAGRAEEAIPHLETALELEGGGLMIRANLAEALRQSGRLDQALDEYKAVLSQLPPADPVYRELRRAYQQLVYEMGQRE